MVLKIYKKENEYYYILSMCKKSEGKQIWTDYFITEKVARLIIANNVCKVIDKSLEKESK